MFDMSVVTKCSADIVYSDELLCCITQMISVLPDWKKIGDHIGILDKPSDENTCEHIALDMLETLWQDSNLHVYCGKLHYAFMSHHQELL